MEQRNDYKRFAIIGIFIIVILILGSYFGIKEINYRIEYSKKSAEALIHNTSYMLYLSDQPISGAAIPVVFTLGGDVIIEVKTLGSNEFIRYEDNLHFTHNPSAKDYINPFGRFKSTAYRDQYGSIYEFKFEQISQ